MIKKIKLNNFQCHEKPVFRFTEGVNIITGTSDVGKTSIIRALKWVLLNKPRGDRFIRKGTNNCSVSIYFDNGKIKRQKKGNKNTYIINDNDEYSSFGAEIPEDVFNVSGITDINFQFQYDSPFMLSVSGPEFTKMLNKYVNLEKIDKSQQFLSSKIKEYKSSLKFYKNDIEKEKEELKKFSELDKIKESLNKIKKIEQEMESLTMDYNKLKKLFTDTIAMKKLLNKYKYIKELETTVTALEMLFKDASEYKTRREKLIRLFNDLKKEEVKIKNCEMKIIENQKFLDEQKGKECPLCGNKIKNLLR